MEKNFVVHGCTYLKITEQKMKLSSNKKKQTNKQTNCKNLQRKTKTCEWFIQRIQSMHENKGKNTDLFSCYKYTQQQP